MSHGLAKANPPRASVVVLTYNSAPFIGPCLGSLAQLTGGPTEIIVVDNDSVDGSPDAARKAAQAARLDIRLIELRPNRGCAGGNNAGWRAARGEFIVFLNPDTEVTPTFVDALIAPMRSDASIGITGAKIYYPGTRTLQHAGGIIHPNAMTNHYGAGEEDTGQYDTPRDCAYVTGAGFAVRRSVLERLGGFDEDFYPAYFEETDLCLRARRAGWRVVYVPEAVFYHHESVSLVVNSPQFRRLYQRMRILYCLKNFSLGDWVRFARFERWWMMNEPAARGHRLEQFRAYGEGLSWFIRTRLRPVSRRWPAG
ncbi:MAG: glycosyltransferase family 2 protein [Candidatus Sumerlaeaceae bacterium]|nr:glycosyltransferase family 2 protein [Candidatus Sumerlaeaceae bacterium]